MPWNLQYINIPFLSLHLTPPTPFIISCFRKCFSHITVFLLTRKPSRRSWRFIKLHQRALAGFLVGNLKKCNPDLLPFPSILYSKLLHSAAAHSFPRLRCFLLFPFPSCFLFFFLSYFGSILRKEKRRARACTGLANRAEKRLRMCVDLRQRTQAQARAHSKWLPFCGK